MALLVAISTVFTGCEDSKSYADLLNDETKCINFFLADQRVEGVVPGDSVFVTRYELAEKILEEKHISVTNPEYDKKFSEVLDSMINNPSIDAPFYRMDEDGDVYMRVVKTGDMDDRPEFNDLVYLRLTRYNLQEYDGKLPEGYGTHMMSLRPSQYVMTMRVPNLTLSGVKAFKCLSTIWVTDAKPRL